MGTKKCISAGWCVGGACSGKKSETDPLRMPWYAQIEKMFGKQVAKDPENIISRSVEKTGREAGNLLTGGIKPQLMVVIIQQESFSAQCLHCSLSAQLPSLFSVLRLSCTAQGITQTEKHPPEIRIP